METQTTEYNQKVIEHFLNPRNIGEIPNADGYAKIGDPTCGDYIEVWILVHNDTIIDFKYKVFGCWGAISTTSVVSELAIGKSLKEAIRLTDDDVVQELGGIPAEKQHCSLLGIQGLRTAIADFLIKDNHQKYSWRVQLYRDQGYDIPLIRQKIAEQIADLPPNALIADVGDGKGHLAIAIAQSGKKCTALDLSSDEIYLAKLNAIYFKVDELIDFQIQDARQLKFNSNYFDAVLSCALMHHLIHPELVLTEMLRVCKPEGRIIISDLNEKGKAAVAQVHQQEGREHIITGWDMEKVEQWFIKKGNTVSAFDEGGERILIIQNIKK